MSPGLSNVQPSLEPLSDSTSLPAPGKPEDASRAGDGSDAGQGAPQWVELVGRVQSGEARGLEDLYKLFSKGIRFFLCRQLGPQDLDDKVHDTFLIVVQAIQRGDLREPERLMGFVRTVVRRQVAAYIDRAVQVRRECAELECGSAVTDQKKSPEENAIDRQQDEIVEKVLRSISRRDREILTRFYLLEQTQEQICTEMNLTETQFRLLKSRAKARFGELGRKKLNRKRISERKTMAEVLSLRSNPGDERPSR